MRKGFPSSSSQSKEQGQEIKQASDQSNFILKAFEIISNSEHFDVIHWSKSGYSFIIEDIDRFEELVLPKYFRHNRYQSFVRQLNMYDFHKVRNGDYYCQNKSEFKHEEFYRSNYPNILNIKRKGFKAKPPGKQSGRKNSKNNTKRIKKSRKPKLPHLQKKTEVLEIYEENEKHSEDDEVSMRIEIENQNEDVQNLEREVVINFVKKFDPSPIIASICEEALKYFRERRLNSKQFTQNASHKNWHIELAQFIKEKWNNQHTPDKNATQYMKEIYRKVKSILQSELHQQEKKEQNGFMSQYPHLQSLQELISIEDEQDLIIDSIFKKEIRSTLISINSETFLNHDFCGHRRNDLMMINL